jgi:hypothetical protein
MPVNEEVLLMRRDYKSWREEEFFGKPLPAEEAKMKQNCSYCGARAYHTPPKRILLACGGCKIAVYCDKFCQKMHRKEHKSDCQKKSGENKEDTHVG